MSERAEFSAAFIGFGEAAQAFVEGWDRADNDNLTAFDINTDDPSAAVRNGKWAEYGRFGLRGCATIAEALQGADTVFSLVTAAQALTAAESAAAHLKERAFFFDGNSCAPATKIRSAQAVAQVGGRYVDVAIMAPVHPALHRVPLLVCGPHARAAVPVLQSLDMKVTEVEGKIGAASSIKMIRSAMMKGLEALVLECVLSGRKAGVADIVLESLDKTYPGFDWKKRSTYMLERVMTHGIRRAAEMREVVRTINDLGLGGAMAHATVDWQQRIGDLSLPAGKGDYGTRADAILRALEGEKV